MDALDRWLAAEFYAEVGAIVMERYFFSLLIRAVVSRCALLSTEGSVGGTLSFLSAGSITTGGLFFLVFCARRMIQPVPTTPKSRSPSKG